MRKLCSLKSFKRIHSNNLENRGLDFWHVFTTLHLLVLCYDLTKYLGSYLELCLHTLLKYDS